MSERAQEEVTKRRERAQRFDTAGAGLEYRPKERDVEEAQLLALKRKRAERFGVAYAAPDETGMMDVGAPRLELPQRAVASPSSQACPAVACGASLELF